MQITEPIDRSMPPAMITTASPSANSEISEMCRTLLRRFSAPRKSGLSAAVMSRERDQHPQHRQLFFHRQEGEGDARRALHFFSSRSSVQNAARLSLLTVVMPVSMVAGGVLPSRMSLSAFIDW